MVWDLTMDHAEKLRRMAAELLAFSEKSNVIRSLKELYDITVDSKSDPEHVMVLYSSLNRLPPNLVKACGINTLGFEDLGPSKEYYPNHGRYRDGTLVINQQIMDDPMLIVDPNSGESMNKFDQTLYHELGHGFDETQAESKYKPLSDQPEWMGLSGWSKEPRPGYKRLRIQEKGVPKIVGEYYYSPKAKFTRFYAKRNPWDDWADSFSYYVSGLKSFLPPEKVQYFDTRLADYYKEA